MKIPQNNDKKELDTRIKNAREGGDVLVVKSIDDNQTSTKLEMLTTTGQKVLESTTGNQIGLSVGNYLVKIITDKQVFVEQVVKE